MIILIQVLIASLEVLDAVFLQETYLGEVICILCIFVHIFSFS